MKVDVEKIIREYIDKTPHMSLATIGGDRPWVSEVHFVYDDTLSLYFVSLQATRHCQEIAVNPHVAGNVIKQYALSESPNGIYFEGTATMIEPTEEDVKRYCDTLKRDAADLSSKLKEADGRRMYRIRVDNWAVFGNFDGSGNAKHELIWNGGQRI